VRNAWIALASALAVHVVDEVVTGFLPVYNAIVRDLSAQYGWMPFPTFTFPIWMGGLAIGIAVLFALTPLVSRGSTPARIASLVLSIVMVANALGHVAASIYLRRPAPGVFSSPLLLGAAVALFLSALRVKASGKTVEG